VARLIAEPRSLSGLLKRRARPPSWPYTENQDVMIQAGFTAIRHVPLGYTVSVGRFWYLPTS
jgi:hypothetical protein